MVTACSGGACCHHCWSLAPARAGPVTGMGVVRRIPGPTKQSKHARRCTGGTEGKPACQWARSQRASTWGGRRGACMGARRPGLQHALCALMQCNHGLMTYITTAGKRVKGLSVVRQGWRIACPGENTLQNACWGAAALKHGCASTVNMPHMKASLPQLPRGVSATLAVCFVGA